MAILLAWASLMTGNPAAAQFGGTQDMMLQKQQQQQQQITRGSSGSHSHSGGSHSGHSHGPHVHQYYFNLPRYNPYGYYGRYPSGYGYNPYGYPYNSGYGYYGNPYYSSPFIYPPRVTVVPHGVPLSSEILSGGYGTPTSPYGAWDNSGVVAPPVVQAPQPQPQAPAPLAPRQAGPEDEIQRRVVALKPSTEAGRLRSDELIADGDREFTAQQYRKAAAKYREAITKAPDYSPGHLRAGHAYIATGDYELAVTYLAMGLELSRTIERPGFTLTDLYHGNQLAKEQHQEALADAILRQPEDGGLLFLAGVTQHYDGRPLQARDYFRRAAALPGRHQPYAAMFLPQPAEAEKE
ncbi:MAG: tetratricopeptide repeat protein [Planctomycetaceae bacterium]